MTTSGKGPFNAENEITKYKLDHSTFDLINVDRFKNTNWSTVFAYMWLWIMIFLSWILLGVDIYTCLNILVFHKWSSDDYKPYAYSVAKWLFTGCIIFQFILLAYHLVWAIHTYRTKNIALAYVNSIARTMYSVKSYNYHCLFHKIDTDNFFDWACFLSYGEVDNALQILLADTPRQVINILTLRYYATDGDLSNDIIANIKKIADTNLRLSIILSFMCLSVIIWSIFFFKFCLGMVMYLPVIAKLRNKGTKSLKKYCCKVVNDKVRLLVLKNHKPKSELLEQGILDMSEIKANPLLNDTVTRFDTDNDYEYQAVDRGVPSYNDNNKLYSSNAYSLQDLSNPFGDQDKASIGKDSLASDSSGTLQEGIDFSENSAKLATSSAFYGSGSGSRYTEPYQNPFSDSNAVLLQGRNMSQSSLTYDPFEPRLTQPGRVQTQPLPHLPRNYSQGTPAPEYTSSSVNPRSFSRKSPPNLDFPPKRSVTEGDLVRSVTEGSVASNTPYPVRGISLYDKNRKKSDAQGTTKSAGMYPSQDTGILFTIFPTPTPYDTFYKTIALLINTFILQINLYTKMILSSTYFPAFFSSCSFFNLANS
ncbi:hypothetical protein CANTEDRAFT_113297 [Yamadazyma tenuis ATCC 10573]|uniref:Vacuolar membrane protein n=1 Tax=Candida tenuis (strain ATCC 10573 / BCRC 21748 / CBS 615 / JCM 9827 / NBRC 10315 / NRRL Y-1498 / VKM Y-70) TaxID=590646 RepID=G3B1T9_CANTC|nr:uncharacterized protein CANTEDRAFT_113297 [Yamadazyma tenuis ATCC 10573]XP_006685816.1 uncharacterized protein CANTEDRAFT_113297 [Yamadazyma tenuis ATCC 10573]EGV65009.1 hypothetical protein CANTEDRAFT_113297 [Yamadazyma tenuis ATCC 10573]EGV65010.1 hypothetical protein CANTEDRAFT_113297 [Yamadazyma tenuis ATCC 10573]